MCRRKYLQNLKQIGIGYSLLSTSESLILRLKLLLSIILIPKKNPNSLSAESTSPPSNFIQTLPKRLFFIHQYSID